MKSRLGSEARPDYYSLRSSLDNPHQTRRPLSRVTFEHSLRLNLASMNTLVNRFSSSSALQNFKNVTQEDDDITDASWGSSAGFGNLGASGIPSFDVPQLSNV